MASGQTHSALWGENGEKWTPESRLPDFSFAGYHCGEKPPPEVEVATNVRTFGARGDGKTDDTEAFKMAIEATREGAILIPQGTYVLSDILWIKKPSIVLRGEGFGKTILHFTTELEDVLPNMSKTTGGRPTSGYSWSGGFLWVKGADASEALSTIASEAKRGDHRLLLDKTAAVKAGDWVTVNMTDDAQKSLLTHIYSGDPGDIKKIIEPITVQFASRIARVSGKQITLERPLRWDIRKGWNPVLRSFGSTVAEVGIEELAILFPVKPYRGHFTERGMNAIAMNGVSHCWVKNVRITNCDSGIFIGGRFCTVDGLRIDGTRTASRGDTGHHGITLGQDCLIANFDVETKFIHDITFTNPQSGNVVKNGKGRNLSFDHHKRGPHENLVCNVDVGDGDQIWRCGGGASLGKNCAARGTFWCVYGKNNMPMPPEGFGPASLNIVGLKTTAKPVTDPNGKWIESIPPEELWPKDLHAAQLARRLQRGSNTPDASDTK
jgi:hypothetical protein